VSWSTMALSYTYGVFSSFGGKKFPAYLIFVFFKEKQITSKLIVLVECWISPLNFNPFIFYICIWGVICVGIFELFWKKKIEIQEEVSISFIFKFLSLGYHICVWVLSRKIVFLGGVVEHKIVHWMCTGNSDFFL
jgi:hypothetical protein